MAGEPAAAARVERRASRVAGGDRCSGLSPPLLPSAPVDATARAEPRGCPAGGVPRCHRPAFSTTAVALSVAVALGAAVAPSQAAPPAFEDSIAQRVLACTGCHGPAGRAAADGYHPRIAGKPAGYLYNQLRNFRDGRRHYAPMTALLGPLGGPTGDLYLLEIARHFAALDLPYPAPSVAAPAAARPGAAAAAGTDASRGEILVRRGDPARQLPACAQCHGEALMGVAPAIPGLLGLPRDYLNAQLGAWRTGQRQAQSPDCMAAVAKRLAPADIAALSGWLAAQPVPAGAKPVPLSAATGAVALPLPCGGVPVAARIEETVR